MSYYTKKLRDLVIDRLESGDYTYKEIADELNISILLVKKIREEYSQNNQWFILFNIYFLVYKYLYTYKF